MFLMKKKKFKNIDVFNFKALLTAIIFFLHVSDFHNTRTLLEIFYLPNIKDSLKTVSIESY